MRFALSGFLFEDKYDAQSVTFTEFCSLAKDAGYDSVDLRKTQLSPDSGAAERRGVRGILDDFGLDVAMLTARGLADSGPERDDLFRRYLDLCAEYQCPLLKVVSDPDWMREAVDRADEAGVTLAANNHINSPLDTVERTRAYFASVGQESLGLLYDAQHLHVAGSDYIAAIREFFPRIRAVLSHSVRSSPHPGAPQKPRFTYADAPWYLAPPEAGGQDWQSIFVKLKGAGYNELFIVFENGWPERDREQIARSRIRFFRELWEEIT
jgi:sugar phosphate isomerase/epimerase